MKVTCNIFGADFRLPPHVPIGLWRCSVLFEWPLTCHIKRDIIVLKYKAGHLRSEQSQYYNLYNSFVAADDVEDEEELSDIGSRKKKKKSSYIEPTRRSSRSRKVIYDDDFVIDGSGSEEESRRKQKEKVRNEKK